MFESTKMQPFKFQGKNPSSILIESVRFFVYQNAVIRCPIRLSHKQIPGKLHEVEKVPRIHFIRDLR